jgi:CheY-like chemotaxis protein
MPRSSSRRCSSPRAATYSQLCRKNSRETAATLAERGALISRIRSCSNADRGIGGVEAAGDPPAAPPAPLGDAPAGTETTLLVEDEDAVRTLAREILDSAGYQVLEGLTPEDALAVAAAHAGPIHLVLTDVILPRISGRQLAEALRSSRPEARVLFTSGYTDDAISHHGILEPGVHFLQKPFTRAALLRKVREVLDH